jgi:hypothetical protein
MSTQTTQRHTGQTRTATRERRRGTPPERTNADAVDRTILEVVDRGGLHITEHELRYQLRRRNVDLVALLERMMELEHRGLTESTLCFRLTRAGIESLPDGHERPLVAGYRSDWR